MRLSGVSKRMRDFLSNLIARGSTDAPVIQPRLPSLFESSSELQSSIGAIGAVETIAPADVRASDAKISPVRRTTAEKRDEVREQKMIPQNVPPWNPKISRLGQIAPEEP